MQVFTYITSTCLRRGDLQAASLVSLSKHSLHGIIDHKYGQGFT